MKKIFKYYLNKLGFSVVPGNDFKRPLIKWAEFQNRQPTNDEIDQWFQNHAIKSALIVCGDISNLAVIDIDGEKGFNWLEEQGPLPDTPSVQSKHGRHYYFRLPDGVFIPTFSPAPEVEVLSNGHLVTAPGSRANDHEYEWISSPEEQEIATLPDWIERLAKGKINTGAAPVFGHNEKDFDANGNTKYGLAMLDDEVNILLGTSDGNRNNQLNLGVFKCAQYIPTGHLNPYTVQSRFEEAACIVKLDQDKNCGLKGIRNTISSGLAAGIRYPKEPRDNNIQPKINVGSEPTEVIEVDYNVVEDYRLTSPGNAKRFVKQHGNKIKFCKKWNEWLIYNGQYWARDSMCEIESMAKQTAITIYEEAKNEGNEYRRKEIAKWAIRSESRDAIQSMIYFARSESDVPILPEAFDQNQWLFNIENGTIDLKTGEKLPHNKDDLITKIAPVRYDKDGECPRFKKFMREIFEEDQEMIDFMQRIFGYCLTGSVVDDILPILWGEGANGKSTLVGTMSALFGDYAKRASADLLLAKKDKHPTSVADLAGSRLVVAIEAEEEKKLAEQLAKQMSGGDRIKARFMHENFFEFDPTFKIMLATNHKPPVEDTTYAIWRRIYLIPFERIFDESEMDKSLREEKFRVEWPGILNWLLQGCLEWQRSGLKPPEKVVDATNEYRSDNDVLFDFLETFTIKRKGENTLRDNLYARYKEYCENNDDMPISVEAFVRRLKKKGYVIRNRGAGGKMKYILNTTLINQEE